jgi:putative transposase
MATPISNEQWLRRVAIRRRLQGERPTDICRALGRSLQWLNKWWQRYPAQPGTDFADRSRVPHSSPRRVAAPVEAASVRVRHIREARATPAARYGLIGSRTIQGELRRLGIHPLPSEATLQRVLPRQGLTHPRGANSASAYYPWPTAWAPDAIHAPDFILRHLQGGVAVQDLHTIDLFSHAVSLSQPPTKSSAVVAAHLLQTWRTLGLPVLQQLDNESLFRGGHTHARVLGHVVRLCLWCGIDPLFTPDYEPKRNHQSETFHSLWLQGFWSKTRFRSLAHVQRESPLFVHWYHTAYVLPPPLRQTPAQVRADFVPFLLSPALQPLIPAGRLPLTGGYLPFMRKGDPQGAVRLLNDTSSVGRRWSGLYVRVTINTAAQRLSIWHQPSAPADWRCLKTFTFRIKEALHPLASW